MATKARIRKSRITDWRPFVRLLLEREADRCECCGTIEWALEECLPCKPVRDALAELEEEKPWMSKTL